MKNVEPAIRIRTSWRYWAGAKTQLQESNLWSVRRKAYTTHIVFVRVFSSEVKGVMKAFVMLN